MGKPRRGRVLARLVRLGRQILQPVPTAAGGIKRAPAAAVPAVTPEPPPAPHSTSEELPGAGAPRLKVAPLTGTFGARVENLDLAAELSAEEVGEIKAALSRFKLLVIEGQDHISPEQLREFAGHWGKGETAKHPQHAQVEGCPEVYIIRPQSSGGPGSGSFDRFEPGSDRFREWIDNNWHRDGPPRERTEWLSFLHARDIPEAGRDTLFADMEAAYERLSPALREYLDTLTALSDWGANTPPAGYKGPYEHPVIITDEAGRKAVYVDQFYTRRIVGLRKEESDWLLGFLCRLVAVPELQCRVRWKKGNLVIWENEKTCHYIVRDKSYDRIMHRVMVNARPLDSQGRSQDLTTH